MKKLFVKNNGITVIALIITILVIFIIVGVILTSVNKTNVTYKLNNMYADIELLSENIEKYYNNYGILPITNKINIEETNNDLRPILSETESYYTIDLKKLNNITLNYGKGTLENKDIYIINENTLEVYYLKGIEIEGIKYYKRQ